MSTETEIKQNVREFYDQIGWQEVSEGVYQNAHYEDLRPVAQEYISRCHLRVLRHLQTEGGYLLDAGSGPIQYPEYLKYSEGYDFRVCADISIQALMEARKRIGEHGLFVFCDIAHLPFPPNVFDGLVSLHTIHHLPIDEHTRAYGELHRVLAPEKTGVVVNGWYRPPLAEFLSRLRKFVLRVQGFVAHRLLGRPYDREKVNPAGAKDDSDVKHTFIEKNSPAWFKRQIAPKFPLEIYVWRSVNVKHTRAFIHERWGGRGILRFLFWLEDRFPRWFGENGQYPLVVIRKV